MAARSELACSSNARQWSDSVKGMIKDDGDDVKKGVFFFCGTSRRSGAGRRWTGIASFDDGKCNGVMVGILRQPLHDDEDTKSSYFWRYRYIYRLYVILIP